METFKGYSIAEETEALLRLPMQALFRQSKILHIKDNKLKVSIPVPVVLRCRPLLIKCFRDRYSPDYFRCILSLDDYLLQ